MAEIRAFHALRYAPPTDLAQVTCPPYDVLSPAARRALLDRSPHATAHLILPEGDGDTRYPHAAALLDTWLREQVLVEDTTPGLYVTRTEFSQPGSDTRSHRLGLMALLRLHEYADRVVLPHEHTLTGPKADRRKLLEATQANIESIMALVDDETGAVYAALSRATTGEPLAHFAGDDGQTHTLYKIDDPAQIAELTALLAPAPVYIADGHHRYETSVAHARDLGALGTDRPEAFLLATVSTFSDPGLVVFPTHRLIRNTPPQLLHSLFVQMAHLWEVHKTDLADLEGRLRVGIGNQPVFGLVLSEKEVYQITARAPDALQSSLPADLPPCLRELDVVTLQFLVLEQAFGLPADETATTDRLAYTRDADEAYALVQSGAFDAALLLPYPDAACVREVSLAGEVMPQKSTFFYPKLLSGLVMRKF